uniref:pentatricopeptide repeat-containing protein At1g62670, mitochondrial-like isoform X2 n=1 Tax=Erigeron canadensis TaxID=72917 RepID=UPI001CB89641|nr:pentatricopeptide repeat-containing protein At1g62670, mitochondrial-like isoform X2 [Erigeron canadensis]
MAKLVNSANFASPTSYNFKGITINSLISSIISAFHFHSSNHFDVDPPPRSIYQKVSKLEDALNLFDEMSQRTPLPSVIYFTQLLNCVTKMKHFSHSIHLFKRICSLGLPVNEYTTSIAIKCCCHLSRTNDGFALLGFCFRRSIVPNVFIFSTLLDGLILEDRILEAERFFKKLIKQKLCEPNVVMYSTMIKGLCKIGNNAIAISLLRLMDERGCKPNLVVYSTIIDSLCKDQMIDDAFKLFKEMVFQKRIAPNVITYSSLISGLSKLNQWDEVYKMLKEMEDYRISPDVHTYSILVDAFCKEGRVKDAETVINVMIEKGKVPDIVTYSSLIDGYCLRGEMTKAKTVFDSMVFKGIIPNVVTYNSLLNGYSKSLKVDEALQMYSEMPRIGLKPNTITYNTMLQGLFRAGRCGVARKLFDEMRAQGLVPDEMTYGIVLEGLCNNHLVEDAISLFNLMGSLGDAKQLFLKMGESGCSPNSVTYNVLLQGYLKNKHYVDVEMLLQEMEGRGYSLDVSTISLLIDSIAAGSLGTTISKLIGKLVPKEFRDSPKFAT